VDKAEALQRKVRNFSPWFQATPECLAIAVTIARAFPEEGSVWVKSVEIKDLSKITCSGSARSNQDVLTLVAALQRA
jgi:Tfp pilus assembly protein PilN